MAVTISIDDRHLVESYQAGDTHAFDDLVEAYAPSLMGHALRRLNDRAAAEDAVQETFVRAYRALPRFDGDYRVGPWLHRILANVCADEGNRRRREAEKFDRFAADPFAADLAPGVEDELGLDFDDANLAEALQSLPANYREALNLRFVQELPYDEVARAAGVSEQNARARVSRARSAARAALRGVAAIPVLLVPALRRTESVAAAAAPSEAVRVAADAVAASAPATTPMVTKAVVGISVVAAFAAPSSVEPLSPGRAVNSAAVAAPEVVTAPESPEAPVVVAPADPAPTPATTAALGGGSGEAAVTDGVDAENEPSTTAPEKAEAPASDPVALPSTDDANDQPGSGSTAPPVAGADDDPAPEVVQPSGGSLDVAGLSLTPAGPRFNVGGNATLVLGERILEGTVTGRLFHTDQIDVRRFTLELTVTLADGNTVAVRVQAQGRAIGEQAEVDLADVTAFDLAGPFRATAPDAVGLIGSGSASGVLDYTAATLSLQLS